MPMNDSRDAKIQKLCIAHIEKHSMDTHEWQHTILGRFHEGIGALRSDELPIVSIYFSPASWCALTTQRVLGTYFGHLVDVQTSDVIDSSFGNFKGHGSKTIEVLTLGTSSDKEVRLEYETGKASMAPIYYLQFWKRKYPILAKLTG